MAAPALRVVEREARVFRRLWRGNFFSSFLSPLLYLGAMGLGIGGLVDARTGGVGDLTYLQFVAPGLLVATALQLAAGESLWPVMGGMKWSRHFHAMVAAPLRAPDVLAGTLAWLAIRLVVSTTAFLIVATVLGGVASAGAVLAIPAAVLTGVAMAAPISAFSAGQQEDSRFALVMRFVVLPLFLFSGTFFPVEQLPDWLRPFVWCSPLWHGIELARAATTGRWPAPALVLLHVLFLLAVLAAGWVWAVRTFTRRLAA
jgi:lipooligosaccharide transport system permease protein